MSRVDDASLRVGHAVSHYRIIEKLSRGGMGVVYKAEDLEGEANSARTTFEENPFRRWMIFTYLCFAPVFCCPRTLETPMYRCNQDWTTALRAPHQVDT